MIVRKLTVDDQISLQKLWSICFMYSMNVEEAEKNAGAKKEAPSGWGAFTDDGEMIAGVIGNRLTMNFDGNKSPLIGIGGVVTHPSYRKSGAIRNIMKQLLTEARKEGAVFSGLYPFNHEFYRKFGYELSRDLETYTFPFRSIQKYASDVKTRLIAPGEDTLFLKDVYDKMIGRYQLAIDRDQEAFKRATVSDPYAKNDYTYAIYDNDDVCAYVSFSKKNSTLSVKDYGFSCEKDFVKILSFLSRFSPEFENAEISLPEDIPIAMLTSDPYSVEKKVDHRYMMRVLNCEKALSIMKRYILSPFIIEIHDPFLPENSGKWRISSDGCKQTDESADVSMSIQAFSQLISGYCGFEGTLFRDDVQLYSNFEAIKAAFPRKARFLGVFY